MESGRVVFFQHDEGVMANGRVSAPNRGSTVWIRAHSSGPLAASVHIDPEQVPNGQQPMTGHSGRRQGGEAVQMLAYARRPPDVSAHHHAPPSGLSPIRYESSNHSPVRSPSS